MPCVKIVKEILESPPELHTSRRCRESVMVVDWTSTPRRNVPMYGTYAITVEKLGIECQDLSGSCGAGCVPGEFCGFKVIQCESNSGIQGSSTESEDRGQCESKKRTWIELRSRQRQS